jgi:hypothetical protein
VGLRSIFRRKNPLELDHPDFGRLVFNPTDHTWSTQHCEFWGVRGLQLVVEGTAAGPSDEQAAAYRQLLAAKDELLPRCQVALASLVIGEPSESSKFDLTGLSVPRLEGTPQTELWNLWFYLRGDDHYMYGVQSSDRWQTLKPYRDD